VLYSDKDFKAQSKMSNNMSMLVANVLIKDGDQSLTAVKGPDYIRLAFAYRLQGEPDSLCFIRPIKDGVRVEFKMTPNSKRTALVRKERTIEIIFVEDANHDSLYIVNGKRKTPYTQKNQKNMKGLVSLALYKQKLMMLEE